MVQDTWPWQLHAENFNAGVMSITPSLEKFFFIINMTNIFPLGGNAEQGLLNNLFSLPSPETLDSAIYLRTELPKIYNLNVEIYRSFRDTWDELWPHSRIVP